MFGRISKTSRCSLPPPYSQTAESAKEKIEFLESNPVTKNMTAVKHHRYVLLSGQAMNPTIRTVEATELVAESLREFGLAG